MPDAETKYPLQFNSYALLSPIYLTQGRPGAGSGSGPIFVNDAKILASHLIQIDADTYQTLHVIDKPLEFAHLNRRAQLRASQPTSPSSAASLGAPASATAARFASLKRPLHLDDLAGRQEANELAGAIADFHERFRDLPANQPQVDLFHERSLRLAQLPAAAQRIPPPSRQQLNLERLGRHFRQHQQLRGRLFQLNESHSLNTYFLPVASDELDNLLDAPESKLAGYLALAAHVIPDQALFTRPMSLGQPHATLFDRHSTSGQLVSLSLAKTLPQGLAAEGPAGDLGDATSAEQLSRRLLATPLLVQAKCSSPSAEPSSADHFWNGLTSAEILVANIPLSNGVLHLIKRPLLVQETNLLDYINDDDHQLSDIVQSLGTQSAPSEWFRSATGSASLRLSRFRELLAREREILSTLHGGGSGNRTILAPTDEAFSRLRYDLRALVEGDESLIPSHWDPAYRADLLERLVKRHIVPHQALTSDQLFRSPGPITAASAKGQPLQFRAEAGSGLIQVECESRAQLIHRDLIGSNGVLHLIDRVLGEEQETVYSLLRSLVLRLEQVSLGQGELAQLVESSLRSSAAISPSETAPPTDQELDANGNGNKQQPQQRRQAPEMVLISKLVGQYLDELGRERRQQLASSVNISFQLARAASRAEGRDDWNERFKQPDHLFTYFVPTDLAWLRLQQAQPELYRPLMHFLAAAGQEVQPEPAAAAAGEQQQQVVAPGASSGGSQPASESDRQRPRSSESSQRLLQVSGSLRRTSPPKLDLPSALELALAQLCRARASKID